MARPTKQGIDYFPIDVQFDEKVELFIAETGGEGLGVLVTIWQLIYQNNGYYIDNGHDLFLLVRRRIMSDINTIEKAVNAAVSRGIFDKNLHEKFNILTSKAIQKRYFIGSKKKKLVSVVENYLLDGVSAGENSVNVVGNATNVKVKEEVEVEEEGGKPKPLSKNKFSDDDYQSAIFIDNKIKELTGSTKPVNLESWANEIRLMRERDNRTPKEISELFMWANNHSFWRRNILSPSKLRQQWDKLKLNKESENEKSNGHNYDNRSRAKRVSDKLDEIIKQDIEENGFTEFVGGDNI